MEEEITKNPQYIQLPTKLPPAATKYFAEDIGNRYQTKFNDDIRGNYANGCHNVAVNYYYYKCASEYFENIIAKQTSPQQNDDKTYILESKYILAVWYLFGIGGRNPYSISQDIDKSIKYLTELITEGHENSITFLNYILDFIYKNIEVTEETKQQIENIINNIKNISSLQDTEKDKLKEYIIKLLNTNYENGKETIIEQLTNNSEFKKYITTKQEEIIRNCGQIVSQIKYKENDALDKGLKSIEINEKGAQYYYKSYQLLKSSANFYQDPISSYIVGLWSLFGKDGTGDYTVEPNPLDAVKYLGQAIVGYNETTDNNTFIQNYNIELTTIKFLYGLSLILASEFSNFEDLKTLLQQQGIDISNINNKNDIIQLGIDIVNDSKLLNTQENEVIHNIIERLKDIKYNEKTYSIFTCKEGRSSTKDHHNIDDIFRIAECVLQEYETQQQTQQGRNDNLSEKLGRALTHYEINHRTVTINKNSILPTEKLENTLQILQQIKIQIDEQDERIKKIRELEKKRKDLINKRNRLVGQNKRCDKTQEYIQEQPQIKKIEDKIKQKIETIEVIDLREYAFRIIRIEENRKNAREKLEEQVREFNNKYQQTHKTKKQNPKTTPTSKAIRKPTEIRKEDIKEMEEIKITDATPTNNTMCRLPSLSTLRLEKPYMFFTNMKQSYPCPFPALELKEKEEEQIAIINLDEDSQEVKEIKEMEEEKQETMTEFITMESMPTGGFGTTIHHEQHSPRSYFGSSFQNSGNGMMMRHDFSDNFDTNYCYDINYYGINEQKEQKEQSKQRITQEQKEKVIQTALTRQPVKRQPDHEETTRLMDNEVPHKKMSKYSENKLSNTTEKEGKAINLTSTEDKEEVQMEEIRQENGELNQQYTQLQQLNQVNQQIGTDNNQEVNQNTGL